MEEIVCDDEIPFGDEIRLDAGWVDFISSKPVALISSELVRISSLREQGFHFMMPGRLGTQGLTVPEARKISRRLAGGCRQALDLVSALGP